MLVWEKISIVPLVLRTKVPGGWLLTEDRGELLFINDPTHQWVLEDVEPTPVPVPVTVEPTPVPVPVTVEPTPVPVVPRFRKRNRKSIIYK